MKKIKIYTTNHCPFCIKAKSLLKKKNIKFSEINVSNNALLREKMVEIVSKKFICIPYRVVYLYKLVLIIT